MARTGILVFFRAILVLGLIIFAWGPALGDEGSGGDKPGGLLTIGKISPSPVDLKVTVKKPQSKQAGTGESGAVTFRTSEKAYVVVLAIPNRGAPYLLFPNSRHPAAAVLPDKEYTVTGPGTGVKALASDSRNAVKMVFFAAKGGQGLHALKVLRARRWLRAFRENRRVEALKKAIAAMSRMRGFNRVALPHGVQLVGYTTEADVKPGSPKGLRLMGVPDSKDPVGITGGQGRAGSEKRGLTGQ